MSNRLNENTARAIQEAIKTRKVKILVGMYDAVDDLTAFRIEIEKGQILQIDLKTEAIRQNWRLAAAQIVRQIDEYKEDHDGIREKKYTVLRRRI